MNETDDGNRPQRLQKILSAYGVTSRRKAEELISAGRVSVNGTVASLGQSAAAGADKIEIDGKPLARKEPALYIMLNKPCGYITTLSDEKDRKTVMSLVRNTGSRLYPVGRLDMNSEGLLLMTNDGSFAQAVAHPSNGKRKTYEVHISGDAKTAARLLRRPVRIDGRPAQAADVRVVSSSDGKGILAITIEEGRNRQIRKMCAACGVEVKALKRVSIGDLKLGTLPPGKWRHLTNDEIRTLGGTPPLTH